MRKVKRERREERVGMVEDEGGEVWRGGSKRTRLWWRLVVVEGMGMGYGVRVWMCV